MNLYFIKVDIDRSSAAFLNFFLGGCEEPLRETAEEEHWGVPWKGPSRLQRVTGIWPHLFLAGHKEWHVSNALRETCRGIPHLVFRPAIIDKLVEYDDLERFEISVDLLELWDDDPTINDWMEEHEHRPDLVPKGVYYHQMFVPRLVMDVLPGLAPLRDENRVAIEGGIVFSEEALAFCRQHRQVMEAYPVLGHGLKLIVQESVYQRWLPFIDQRVHAVEVQEL